MFCVKDILYLGAYECYIITQRGGEKYHFLGNYKGYDLYLLNERIIGAQKEQEYGFSFSENVLSFSSTRARPYIADKILFEGYMRALELGYLNHKNS